MTKPILPRIHWQCLGDRMNHNSSRNIKRALANAENRPPARVFALDSERTCVGVVPQAGDVSSDVAPVALLATFPLPHQRDDCGGPEQLRPPSVCRVQVAQSYREPEGRRAIRRPVARRAGEQFRTRAWQVDPRAISRTEGCRPIAIVSSCLPSRILPSVNPFSDPVSFAGAFARPALQLHTRLQLLSARVRVQLLRQRELRRPFRALYAREGSKGACLFCARSTDTRRRAH